MPTTTTAPAAKLTIMVTNDDGVDAPGINAVVQGLRTLPHTEVTVVAPLTNQSGTGGKTSAGALTTSAATTASGYPAVAVHGYPADTVIWAVKDHGLPFRPDLVVSGINFGQNIGPLAALSGTVGAAREAVTLGVPALAASQGVDNGSSPLFAQAVPLVEQWVTDHRSAAPRPHLRHGPAAGEPQRAQLSRRIGARTGHDGDGRHRGRRGDDDGRLHLDVDDVHRRPRGVRDRLRHVDPALPAHLTHRQIPLYCSAVPGRRVPSCRGRPPRPGTSE